MSYRIDSEVSDCSYGCTYLRNYQKPYDKDLNNYILFGIKNQFKLRSTSALWFVSNCDAKYRIKFTSELKEYFPVKIIGDCAKFVSSEKESAVWTFVSRLFDEKCNRYSKCETGEFLKHKFYLSFESKNCSNYLTEKLWRILRTDMIPVVLQPAKSFMN